MNENRSTTREKRCSWCGLSKFGEHRCICDSPSFEMMEQCVDCGEWKPVDRLTVNFDDPEERPFCAIGCSVDV